MPNADFDLLRGIGLVERYFRGGFQRGFLSENRLFFRFSQKNIVKFLCLGKEVLRIVYIYKKEDCDAATACIIPKENANCSGAVAIRTKYAPVSKAQKGSGICSHRYRSRIYANHSIAILLSEASFF